jgi:hypothetical protein
VLKISRITIIVATIAIVAILSVGLILGLGMIRLNGTTETSTAILQQTIVETETQNLAATTQTVYSTVSLSPVITTTTATETRLSVSQSTLRIPTTVNLTQTDTALITSTVTTNITTTASGYVVLLPAGSQITFTAGEMSDYVSKASITPGFNGFLEIDYQTKNSTSIHWLLQENTVNETSVSLPQGGVEFPVQANIPYSLLVFNDGCSSFGCSNAFNVTASVVYLY